MIPFLHAADFHLDSAFGALPPQQAAARRRESRELPFRLADYVNEHEIRLVLLAGDLFDSPSPYRETVEQLAEALARMEAMVFITPGNHDWYGPASPWAAFAWPENVYIFTRNAMTAVEIPDWNLVVHGAAFTGPEQTRSLLSGFAAPEDGHIHIGILHGEIEPPEDRYNPIRREDLASSGLAYLALGHIHKSGAVSAGKTVCVWPGCPEGRGFDELGEKGLGQGTIGPDGKLSMTFVPFAQRRYEVLEVDVTGRSPREAVEAALPADTGKDLYRILLTGETGEQGADCKALETALSGRFYALEIRDRTRIAEDLWARAGENSLRGLFLQDLRAQWQKAPTDRERELITQAARFGLAALDRRDLD